MATFNVTGFDEVELMLLKQADAVEKFAPDMLKAGADILANAQRQALSSLSKTNRSVGTLASSINVGNMKKSKTSVYMDVYPQGNQPHGIPRKGKRSAVSNAQVGFMLEYGYTVRDRNGRGVGSVPGRRWLSSAASKSASAVHDAMKRVWEEKQNG